MSSLGARRSGPSVALAFCKNQSTLSTTWFTPAAKSQKTLHASRPRRRLCPSRSAIRACFSTISTSRGRGGVPLVQRSRNFMGALDAHAHQAASDEQTPASMANGVVTMSTRFSSLFFTTTECAHDVHTIFCCLHVPARVNLLTDLALVDAMARLVTFVPVCTRLFASRPSCVALHL